jgi:hypothetical protein
MTDSDKIKELEQTIVELKAKLAEALLKVGGDKVLLDHYVRLFTATAANYLMDPDPIELKCSGSKMGTSFTYMVKIKSIVAIKSEGRLKKIYLSEPHKPLESGPKSDVIYYNNNASDWDALLFKLQRIHQFLFRVHKSNAINIYHYTLNDENIFQINDLVKDSANELIHSIPTDSQFDVTTYTFRLLELKQLNDKQIGFALDIQKLKEISRYT